MGAFLTALGAAALALAGNYLMLTLQTRQSVRAERRAFVRELHAETVDLVVDLSMFVRELSAAALIGGTSEEIEQIERLIDDRWEGDLMRRVRRVEFGHPDPDVREAAERLQDDMWPLIIEARREESDRLTGPFGSPRDPHAGVNAWRTVGGALEEMRRAVHAAPHRDVPPIRYTGAEIPSRLSRALERQIEEEDAKAAAGDPTADPSHPRQMLNWLRESAPGGPVTVDFRRWATKAGRRPRGDGRR